MALALSLYLTTFSLVGIGTSRNYAQECVTELFNVESLTASPEEV